MRIITLEDYESLPVLGNIRQCPSGDYSALPSIRSDSHFASGCRFDVGTFFGFGCEFSADTTFGADCYFANGCRYDEDDSSIVFGGGCTWQYDEEYNQ